MSRTYRCRHLPALPGSARRFVDAHVRTIGRLADELIEAQLPPKPNILEDRDAWRAWWARFDQLKAAQIRPVAPLWGHPWVSWGMVGTRAKEWYKRTGNRRVRRRARQLVRRSVELGDDFQVPFPRKDDGWDTWSLW